MSLVFQSIAGIFEGLITYSAGVRSLIAVGQQMLLKVFLCSTDFPTELTGFFRIRKRFHPILQQHIILTQTQTLTGSDQRYRKELPMRLV